MNAQRLFSYHPNEWEGVFNRRFEETSFEVSFRSFAFFTEKDLWCNSEPEGLNQAITDQRVTTSFTEIYFDRGTLVRWIRPLRWLWPVHMQSGLNKGSTSAGSLTKGSKYNVVTFLEKLEAVAWITATAPVEEQEGDNSVPNIHDNVYRYTSRRSTTNHSEKNCRREMMF